MIKMIKMIEHFPYKVLLTDKRTSSPAKKWCYTEFGLRPIKWIKIQSCPTCVYDLEKGTWYNKINHDPMAFYFKCPADAIAFKLRWQ